MEINRGGNVKIMNAGKLEGDHGETVGVWVGVEIPGYEVEQVNIGFDILAQVVEFYRGNFRFHEKVSDLRGVRI